MTQLTKNLLAMLIGTLVGLGVGDILWNHGHNWGTIVLVEYTLVIINLFIPNKAQS
jgi:hypothetical protein